MKIEVPHLSKSKEPKSLCPLYISFDYFNKKKKTFFLVEYKKEDLEKHQKEKVHFQVKETKMLLCLRYIIPKGDPNEALSPFSH